MAVIKVSIKDKNTLELQEDAKKGDTIDLSSLSTADVSSVTEAVKTQARKEAEQELAKAKAIEIEAELLKQGKALSEQHQKKITELEVEKNKIDLISKNKDGEIARLKNEKEQAIEKERQIKEIEVAKSTTEMEKQIIMLKAELDKKDGVIKSELERKDSQISSLNEKMAHQEKERALETERVLQDIKIEKEKLESALSSKSQEHIISESKLREEHERQVKLLSEELEQVKNYKAKQNIADFGEDLAKYCDVLFENIRLALPSDVDYFKDNEVIDGTKGDRVYKEYDEHGNTVLSIMFEMKDGKEDTKTKQTNEKHFDKLDKDRRKKECEYAVLVSALERDNPIYDRMYPVPKYHDMYVIRPQDFNNIILWLRNVSNKLSLSRRELMVIQERDRDYTEFDKNMDIVRDKFNKHMNAWKDKNDDAVDSIDKMIKGLQKLRDEMLGLHRPLLLASSDLENATVKKLAKNSPSILEQIKSKEKLSEGIAKVKKINEEIVDN